MGFFTRRQVLAATAGVLAAGLPRRAPTQAVAGFDITEIADGLVLLAGAGANVVALRGDTRLLMVDGGLATHATALLAELRALWPNRPVEVLFNTNWRDEHTGANEAVRATGGTVMAHENTKLWLGGDFDVEWEGRHYAPRPSAVAPNKTFYSSGALDFDGQRIEYLHLPRAHTDGDIAVYFRAANVLVASDLLSVRRYPVPDYATGGWIGGLVEATRKLLEVTNAETRVVAAEGGVYGRAELEAQLAMCTAVTQKAAAAFRVGMSFEDFVASKPTAEFDARWGDPALFLKLVHKGAFAHLRELGGVI